MSLDFSLHLPGAASVSMEPRIFIREAGATRQISRAEWDARHPGLEPVTVPPTPDDHRVYHGNITHNLAAMAQACDLYAVLWTPDEVGYTQATSSSLLCRGAWSGCGRIVGSTSLWRAPTAGAPTSSSVRFAPRFWRPASSIQPPPSTSVVKEEPMTCPTVPIPNDAIAIVCSRPLHPATRRCLVCHRPEWQVTMKLCDAVLSGPRAGETLGQAQGRLCSRPVCVEHAYHIEPDVDYCPAHARAMHAAERNGDA